jgi:hypothetical protein
MLNLLFTFLFSERIFFMSSFFQFNFFSGKRQKISFISLKCENFCVSLIYFSLLFYGDERGLCYFSIFIFIFINLYKMREKNHDFFKIWKSFIFFYLIIFMLNLWTHILDFFNFYFYLFRREFSWRDGKFCSSVQK